MSETVVAYGGAQIPVNDLAVTLGYTAGFVTTQTVAYQGVTYVQTFARDGSGNILSVSQWIPQEGFYQDHWKQIGLVLYIESLKKTLNEYRLTLSEHKKNMGFLQDIYKIGVAK
jgi:hypothetical protein